jgi:hypothetical protein
MKCVLKSDYRRQVVLLLSQLPVRGSGTYNLGRVSGIRDKSCVQHGRISWIYAERPVGLGPGLNVE